MTSTKQDGLDLSRPEVDLLAQVLTANIAASQNTSNRVLDRVENERDEAQRALVGLYDALYEAHHTAEVQLRSVGAILQWYGAAADDASRALSHRTSQEES